MESAGAVGRCQEVLAVLGHQVWGSRSTATGDWNSGVLARAGALMPVVSSFPAPGESAPAAHFARLRLWQLPVLPSLRARLSSQARLVAG